MSFSKAKRFVYKTPDVDCSPADYLINLELNSGCSISKSPRFQPHKNKEEESVPCSRLSHHENCMKSKSPTSTKLDNKLVNDKFREFNRDNRARRSVKANNKDDKMKTIMLSGRRRCYNDRKGNPDLYEEFIDDDYVSMTSSEDINGFKSTEEYELNEVCNVLRTLQLNRTAPPPEKTLNFEDAVLYKLEVIDKNVSDIKEDVAYVSRKTNFEPLYDTCHKSNLKNSIQYHRPERNHELRCLVQETMQRLSNNLENKRNSILKHSEEQIVNIIAEMYNLSKKSSNEIQKFCNMTTEELVHNLNGMLQTSTYDYDLKHEIRDILHEIKRNNLNEMFSNYRTTHNIMSDYLEQTREDSQELEEDLSDIAMKCVDTQQMLNVQENILHDMRKEIKELKTSFRN